MRKPPEPTAETVDEIAAKMLEVLHGPDSWERASAGAKFVLRNHVLDFLNKANVPIGVLWLRWALETIPQEPKLRNMTAEQLLSHLINTVTDDA